LAPLTLPAEEIHARFARFGVLCLGLLAAWVWTMRQENADDVGAWHPRRLLRLMRFAAFAWLFHIVGLLIEWHFADRPTQAAGLLRFYWFRLADVAIPLAVALALGAVAVQARRTAARTLTAIATVAGLLAGWQLAAVVSSRWQRPWPPATAKMDDYPSWRAACEWIRSHAPADAMCIVPRSAMSFKWYAQRADVVNYKDIPQDAAGLVEWRRRSEELYTLGRGIDGEPLILNSPEEWGTRRAYELAAEYGARYIVARVDPPLLLRRVFPEGQIADTDWYAVYDLNPAPPPATPPAAP
jgi:hypothetical protein